MAEASIYEIHDPRFRQLIVTSAGLDELYDVAFLPGTSAAELIHPASPKAAQSYAIEPPSIKDQKKAEALQ